LRNDQEKLVSVRVYSNTWELCEDRILGEVCVCDECHNEGREEGDERGVGVKLAEKKYNIIQDNAR